MFFIAVPQFYSMSSFSWLPTAPVTPTMTSLVSSSMEEDTPPIYKNQFCPTILLNPSSSTEGDNRSQSCERDESVKKGKGREQVDDDYRPEGSAGKKSKKTQQLENRNVVPNIVRLILSFIQKKGKSQPILARLMSEHLKSVRCQSQEDTQNLEELCVNTKEQNSLSKRTSKQQTFTPSCSRFYLFHSTLRSSMNNYVNEETLTFLTRLRPSESSIFSLEEQEIYLRMTRVLIRYFLREEIGMCILTSKRMEGGKKKEHMSSSRYIANKLRKLLGRE